MRYKVFFDTNILIDFFDANRPFHKDAEALFQKLKFTSFVAFYSESVVTTLAYILRKYFEKKQLIEIISTLNQKFKLLPCAEIDVQNAINCLPSDFEDALLYQIALTNQMDYFITSNIKDFRRFKKPNLPVVMAHEFNQLLISQE